MGMFDYLRSSYDLGEQFTNVELHTKDMEGGEIGGTMTTYWLDPKGVLWKPDYVGTNKLVFYEEDDPNYDPKHLWLNHECVKTGKRGKYSPHNITGYVRVYPSRWEGKYEDWPTLRLHLRKGILQDFEDITGERWN